MTAHNKYHYTQLRHLSAAMQYESVTGKGVCVQRAMALALDLRNSVLTFGTIRAATEQEQKDIPNASTIPFIHAWVELGDTLYAPTTIEKAKGYLLPFYRPDYYEKNGVYDVHPLPRHLFDTIAHRWDLSSAFKHGSNRAGHADLADEMLKAAGVKYVLSEKRSLLPAPKEDQS